MRRTDAWRMMVGVCACEREGKRDRERETQKERQRQRKRERDSEREKETAKERKRKRKSVLVSEKYGKTFANICLKNCIGRFPRTEHFPQLDIFVSPGNLISLGIFYVKFLSAVTDKLTRLRVLQTSGDLKAYIWQRRESVRDMESACAWEPDRERECVWVQDRGRERECVCICEWVRLEWNRQRKIRAGKFFPTRIFSFSWKSCRWRNCQLDV